MGDFKKIFMSDIAGMNTDDILILNDPLHNFITQCYKLNNCLDKVEYYIQKIKNVVDLIRESLDGKSTSFQD